jgi:hypothetical protein
VTGFKEKVSGKVRKALSIPEHWFRVNHCKRKEVKVYEEISGVIYRFNVSGDFYVEWL